jgi:hypothetical protein
VFGRYTNNNFSRINEIFYLGNFLHSTMLNEVSYDAKNLHTY